MEAQVKTIKKELKTGIHLVTITDASLIKGADGKPLKTVGGETGISVRFTDANQSSFDKPFWLNGDRHKDFLKMLSAAQINSKATAFKAEAKGKRLWIFIKEVWDIDLENIVYHDVTGEPIINYYIFNYSPCVNPENRPMMMGDPAMNNGRASEKFIDYQQIKKNTTITEENFPIEEIKQRPLTPNDSFFKEEKVVQVNKALTDEIDFDNF